jgi:hypothetical protein
LLSFGMDVLWVTTPFVMPPSISAHQAPAT